MIYRKGVLEDLNGIELLIQSAIAHMRSQGIEQWDERYPVYEDFEQDIKSSQLFVGISDNEIAVVFTLNKEYDEAYRNGGWKHPEKLFCIVHRLCVNPKFQNRGIARQTMKYIEKEAVSNGEQAVRLDVYSKNPYALKLYQSCGYEKVGMVEWRKGIFYLMEKYL